MNRGLRLVLAREPEEEYTVECDEWEIKDGVLHTWCRGGAYGRYDDQWFPIVNLSRWAKIT